jgi:hypothetical protein
MCMGWHVELTAFNVGQLMHSTGVKGLSLVPLTEAQPLPEFDDHHHPIIP